MNKHFEFVLCNIIKKLIGRQLVKKLKKQ